MAGIYEPTGRAREYSPLALNLYAGCDHACTYCFNGRGPRGASWSHTAKPQAWLRGDPTRAIARTFQQHAGSREQVLLSFVGDPYCAADVEHRLSRYAVQAALANRVPVSVLTKGGERCLRDLDLFQRFWRSILVGATLTGCDDLDPGAAPNAERLAVLRELHARGIPCWASFEPVIRTEASLALLREAVQVCDLVKVGKVNDWPGCDDKAIDWRAFLLQAKAICDASPCRMYVKRDLWLAAGSPSLPANYRDADAFQALPFEAAVVARKQATLL